MALAVKHVILIMFLYGMSRHYLHHLHVLHDLCKSPWHVAGLAAACASLSTTASA